MTRRPPAERPAARRTQQPGRTADLAQTAQRFEITGRPIEIDQTGQRRKRGGPYRIERGCAWHPRPEASTDSLCPEKKLPPMGQRPLALLSSDLPGFLPAAEPASVPVGEVDQGG